MSSTDKEWDDARVFVIDEGFGNARLKVSVVDSEDCCGGGFVHIFSVDRDASISIDFDIWDRVVKAVARRREG